MRRSTFLDLCFYLSLAAVVVAMGYRAMHSPPGQRIGGDSFILLSPVFFVVAAKRATRFGGAAVMLGGLGLVFSALALWAAFNPR